MNKDKQFISFVLLVGVLIIFSFFADKKTEAGFSFVNGFGGRVTMKQACTCNLDGGSQITIQGPGQSSGTYLESAGTRLYKNNFISSGRNVTGTYTPGGVCMITAYPKCKELQISKGTIKMTGISF